jgi:hypothetical protein
VVHRCGAFEVAQAAGLDGDRDRGEVGAGEPVQAGEGHLQRLARRHRLGGAGRAGRQGRHGQASSNVCSTLVLVVLLLWVLCLKD